MTPTVRDGGEERREDDVHRRAYEICKILGDVNCRERALEPCDASNCFIFELLSLGRSAETERCRRIVERARFDEIDGDFRSIIHRIESHTPAEAD